MVLLRRFLKLCIAVFCIWHIAAVGIYSLYNVEGHPVLEWLDKKKKYVRPYALITSQWQRWNLFSPDPLRRVIEMDIMQWTNGKWQIVKTLNEHNVSFWQRAPELKLMRRMEDENFGPLRERYVEVLCHTAKIPPGTPMRMIKRWYVIPKNDRTQSVDWWRNWEVPWQEPIRQLHINCPTPHALHPTPSL